MVGGQTHFAVPLIVAVTGHRDLVANELPGIRARVCEFLKELLKEYPDRRVSVMTALAEGADQMVAEEALHLGVFLCAHCHILVALWDGKDNDKLGGTSQVVRFHLDDVMPGLHIGSDGQWFYSCRR